MSAFFISPFSKSFILLTIAEIITLSERAGCRLFLNEFFRKENGQYPVPVFLRGISIIIIQIFGN
jgi:hypothetical protein